MSKANILQFVAAILLFMGLYMLYMHFYGNEGKSTIVQAIGNLVLAAACLIISRNPAIGGNK